MYTTYYNILRIYLPCTDLTALWLKPSGAGVNQAAATLWCDSLRARYICIVAVQHCHSGKIDLLILSKLVAVERSVFTCTSAIQFIDLLGSNEEVPQRALQLHLHSLQKNILNAMDSVDVLSSWKLEHRMIQWMDAYRDGKEYNTGKEVWQLQTVLTIEFMSQLLMCLIRHAIFGNDRRPR
jgi:hypothetical protein